MRKKRAGKVRRNKKTRRKVRKSTPKLVSERRLEPDEPFAEPEIERVDEFDVLAYTTP